MNLVERLMAIDSKEITKMAVVEIPSKMLEKLTGEKVLIKLQAIDGDAFAALSASGLDENGEVVFDKSYDTNAKIAAAAVIEPNLKDKSLIRHLGVATPAEAAKVIFKGEVNTIAAKAAEISGFKDEEETRKEVKNSLKAIEK